LFEWVQVNESAKHKRIHFPTMLITNLPLTEMMQLEAKVIAM